MIRGESIILRPVREPDLDRLYAYHIDLANRGDFFPLGIISESQYKSRFRENGFWDQEQGMLLIVNEGDSILGHIEFFRTVSYLDELELSYQIYDHAERGKGYVSEAVKLMVAYLFGRLRFSRIRLLIHPENKPSLRVAEKCGFVHEGTAREVWYHRGKNHDLETYALLRGRKPQSQPQDYGNL